jgi:uncharacterized alkaline shock family protein YloU
VTATVAPRHASPAAPTSPAPTASPVAPEHRGTTTVADVVVEKTAAHAAREVSRAAGLRRQLAGRGFGTPTVRAHADVDGAVTTLRLELGVEFPAPVRQVTRAVRSHVTDRVSVWCGMRVDHVDITVAALPRPTVDTRRVR